MNHSRWDKWRQFRQSFDTAIWVRTFGTALTALTGFMMRPFLALYLYERMDGSVLLPMLVVGLQPLCGMLVNIAAGNLSDRLGRKPVMLTALLIQAAALAGYAAAGSVWIFALLSMLNGAGNALFQPAANAQVSDVVPEEKRPEVFALFHTALNIGAAAGPLVGLALYSWNSHIVFLICACSTLIYAAVLWRKVPETLPAALRRSQGIGAPRGLHMAKHDATPAFRLLEQKALLIITACSIPVSLLYAQVESTFPLHLQSQFTHYKTVYASLMTFNGLAVITLQMWIASRTKHLGPGVIMGTAYSLFALVALGYGFAPYMILLFAVEFLFTIGEMIYGPHMQKLISVIAPESRRGLYFSIYGMSGQLGRAAGPVMGGALMSGIGGRWMFAFLAVLLLTGGAGLLRIIFSIRKEDERIGTSGEIIRKEQSAAAVHVS